MKKIVSLLFLILFTSSSCEKDDICDANTPTTPRLVIEFYDIINPSELKNVKNLKVIGKGMGETAYPFNPTSTGESMYLVNGNKIMIPLKTDSNETTYSFILNSGNPNPTLIDTDEVSFFYSRNEVFVSRACGFKTLFTFNTNSPYTQTAVPSTKPVWMQHITVEKSNIDNENETHVKVFF